MKKEAEFLHEQNVVLLFHSSREHILLMEEKSHKTRAPDIKFPPLKRLNSIEDMNRQNKNDLEKKRYSLLTITVIK